MGRIDQHIMDDSDLAGPILFCLLFGTFLLLVRFYLTCWTYLFFANHFAVRKGTFRLHLRPCPTWVPSSTPDSLPHVAASRSFNGRDFLFPPSRRPADRLITLLLHPHLPAVCLCSRILSPPTSPYIVSRRGHEPGHRFRIHIDLVGNLLVYTQRLRHVLCSGQNAWDAWLGGIPAYVVLYRIRYHGHILQPRCRDSGKRGGWCCGFLKIHG